jgi:hypothetical protein
MIAVAARLRVPSLLAKQHSALPRVATTTTVTTTSPLLIRSSARGYAASQQQQMLPLYSYFHFQPVAQLLRPMIHGSGASRSLLLTTMLPALRSKLTQPSFWYQKIVGLFDNSMFQMSSTLKKRRSKMNKHKLRKRRKLLRRKSNG